MSYDDRPTHPMQMLVDGMNAAQRVRALGQMTLGRMIEALTALPQDARIRGVGDFNSYRGYYCDLACEPGSDMTVEAALKAARECLGQVFQGYKGGDYQMGVITPVHSAPWGSCGLPIIGIRLADDGVYVPELGEDEDA